VKVIDRIKNQYLVQAKDKSVDLYSRYQLNTNTKNTKLAESINDDKKGLIKQILRKIGKDKYEIEYDGGAKDIISEKELRRDNPTKQSPLIEEYLASK
jgi:hypothetical protein